MRGVTPVDRLPDGVTLLRAPNPGPMTLDGTNTWVLRPPGASGAVVVDPGPDDPGHLAAIAAQGPVSAILITHGHHDHVEGAARLSELLGGVPVRAADPAHCVGAPPLTAGVLVLAGLEIEVLPTAGHTRDSVCFRTGDAVFSGDTILGRGTTVVAYPDGDLGSYLDSLTMLTAYQSTLLPGHGPALADCAAAARAYLAHRRDRLAQVEAAMAAGAETAGDIVDVVYPEIDPAIRFAAEASARAQLDYLRRESPPLPEQLDPL
ncbi:glyoxylase-like metal-dependent hydrolase (beta-lactamase superfamily II) [Krasilnikovia cinnamomea]|uniref:Glyoxylase-like metal-dependent hydrolase (Beta-lactamase superfamily II) n=1 Tax=Krasilnikovia cinnamomea TaxID=349313 RepID=A0A4Q7ZK15_9ACTN|nr:MBL fold metallo-hydrolase [Krasilnikovia cinnamomea]RZU50663.1 glyoxylase-like metal-dependent hydrolase (beta-lactamase superfamily II) [Krasilnikovia cinnamomea]